MNKVFLLFLMTSIFFSNKTNYWNLGVYINENNTKKIIKKDMSINDLAIEESNIANNNQMIYTLNKNYIIEPEKKEIFLDFNSNDYEGEYFADIKFLMANDQYFEAAKKLILLDDNDIPSIFDNQNDYYYCSSMIYYNLGNIHEAYFNIDQISDRQNDSKILFLEALILQEIDIEKSYSLFDRIVKEFPDDDYAEYAKNILKDNQ